MYCTHWCTINTPSFGVIFNYHTCKSKTEQLSDAIILTQTRQRVFQV